MPLMVLVRLTTMRKAGSILPKTVTAAAKEAAVTDDGPFTAKVLDTPDEKTGSVRAGKYVRLPLDAMATLLMLAGLVGLYAVGGA